MRRTCSGLLRAPPGNPRRQSRGPARTARRRYRTRPSPLWRSGGHGRTAARAARWPRPGVACSLGRSAPGTRCAPGDRASPVARHPSGRRRLARHNGRSVRRPRSTRRCRAPPPGHRRNARTPSSTTAALRDDPFAACAGRARDGLLAWPVTASRRLCRAPGRYRVRFSRQMPGCRRCGAGPPRPPAQCRRVKVLPGLPGAVGRMAGPACFLLVP